MVKTARVVHLAMADCIYAIALHTRVLWHPRDIPNVRGEFLLLAASCNKVGLSCVGAGPVVAVNPVSDNPPVHYSLVNTVSPYHYVSPSEYCIPCQSSV